jgi:hypothetical protein
MESKNHDFSEKNENAANIAEKNTVYIPKGNGIFSDVDIRNFREEIARYKLSAPFKLGKMTNFELLKVCNGWGPDSWPEKLRAALTRLSGVYAVIHVPHDVRYEFHLGSREEADAEFWQNGKKIWLARWGWHALYRKQAWIEFLALRAAYNALRLFSKSAWEDAANE